MIRCQSGQPGTGFRRRVQFHPPRSDFHSCHLANTLVKPRQRPQIMKLPPPPPVDAVK